MSREPSVLTRRRDVNDDDVFDAVVELSSRYHAPSTSLIIWQLAGGGSVTASFQAAVRDALHRLHAGGRLARVTHRGTGRWSAALERERP
jgi:hypothetical protein